MDSIRTDLAYAIAQLRRIRTEDTTRRAQDSVQRALDALERVEAALAEPIPQPKYAADGPWAGRRIYGERG